MKIMYRKILSILILGIFAFSLVSCGQADNQQKDEEITLSFSWWGDETRYDKTMQAIKLFEDKYPNIKVKPEYGEWTGFKQRMNMEIRGNNECDVIQINYDWLESYSKDGNGFYDLSKLSDQIDLGNFSEEALSYGKKNNVLNGIPTSMNSKVVYYNKNLLDSLGNGKFDSWNDILNYNNSLNMDIYPIADSAENYWTICMNYIDQKTGKTFMDNSGNLTYSQEDIKDLLTLFKSLIDKKFFSSASSVDSENQSINNNKSIAAVTWVTDADKMDKNMKKLSTEAIPGDLPSLDGKSRIRYVKPATLFAISKNTEHPKEAAMLLNFMLNDEEAAKVLGTNRGIPASKAAYNTLEQDNQLTGLQFEASKKDDTVKNVLLSPYYENTTIRGIYKEAIVEVALGKKSPSECAAETYNNLVKNLEIVRQQ